MTARDCGAHELLAYASRTGTRRNLRALRDRGWRLLVSAAGEHRDEGFPYALDNGAYAWWQRELAGEPVDWFAGTTWAPYVALLDKMGANADFAVVPDIPARANSLALSLRWLPEVMRRTPRALIPVQNGMSINQVAPHLGPNIGVFVGGDTAWKEWAVGHWGPWCAERGIWCHVGRVNTARRIRLCSLGRCTSFDGSSASRYAKTLPRLDSARRQGVLPLEFGTSERGA